MDPILFFSLKMTLWGGGKGIELQSESLILSSSEVKFLKQNSQLLVNFFVTVSFLVP